MNIKSARSPGLSGPIPEKCVNSPCHYTIWPATKVEKTASFGNIYKFIFKSPVENKWYFFWGGPV